jgi:hypothetical protein
MRRMLLAAVLLLAAAPATRRRPARPPRPPRRRRVQQARAGPALGVYVTRRGHHHDADACCPDGFTPTLDYVGLQEGETAEG